LKDITLGETRYFRFTTRAFATGIPTVLAGTPVISAYEDDSITQITAGITLTVDFDGVIGLNLITLVATSGNGFEVAKDYDFVITTGTVDSVSVVGETVGEFSIQSEAAAAAIGTAGAGLTDITLNAASIDLVWDEVLTGGTHNVADSSGRRIRDLQEFGVYEGGAVWIDTVNGSAGTTDFESGTAFNPVNTIADANTLATSLGLTRFRVAPGSTITFAATQANQEFLGSGWTLALGGQSIDGTSIEGADVSGIATNSTGMQFFVDCMMGAVTLPGDTHVISCGIAGTQTLGEAGDFFFEGSHSAVAGTSTPTLDFGAALNASVVNIRHHSGGWTVENMGAGTGTYTATFEGDGQITWAASCSATSNASIRGNWKITDNAGGAVTETLDDNQTSVDAILIDVTGINGDAMRGTDGVDTATMRGTDSALLAASINLTGGAVDTVTTLTGHTAQTGDSFARIGAAGASLSDLGGMSAAMKAEILVEVNNALDTAISELAQAAPTATPTMRTGLMLLYMALRNRLDVTTSGTDELQIFNDAGVVIAKKLLTDTGTDYSEAEAISGP